MISPNKDLTSNGRYANEASFSNLWKSEQYLIRCQPSIACFCNFLFQFGKGLRYFSIMLKAMIKRALHGDDENALLRKTLNTLNVCSDVEIKLMTVSKVAACICNLTSIY